MMELLSMIDTTIFFEYLNYSGGVNVDNSFLDSIEKMKAEKKKYGLSTNEKMGLVITGTIECSDPISYTTVLSSDRFLLFCNGNNVKDFAWSNVSTVAHQSGTMQITFKNGESWSIPDRQFCDDDDVKCNRVSSISDFIIGIINHKRNVKNNNQQVP